MAGGEVQIRIRGRLDDRQLSRFADSYGRLEVVETVLAGEIVDASELHGVLHRLQELGYELVEVRRPAGRRAD
jgi:hypothetical protein